LEHIHEVGMQDLYQLRVLLSSGGVVYNALLLVDNRMIGLAPTCTAMAGLPFAEIVNVYIFLVDIVDHFVRAIISFDLQHSTKFAVTQSSCEFYLPFAGVFLQLSSVPSILFCFNRVNDLLCGKTAKNAVLNFQKVHC
jgi:hypothetical protein